jgi:hypothetical protein
MKPQIWDNLRCILGYFRTHWSVPMKTPINNMWTTLPWTNQESKSSYYLTTATRSCSACSVIRVSFHKNKTLWVVPVTRLSSHNNTTLRVLTWSKCLGTVWNEPLCHEADFICRDIFPQLRSGHNKTVCTLSRLRITCRSETNGKHDKTIQFILLFRVYVLIYGWIWSINPKHI